MTNTNAPFGLLSFGRRDGGSPTAGLTRVFIASSDTAAVFKGDLVQYSTANSNYVTWASTGSGGNAIRGVFYGCEYYSAAVGRQVWSAYFPGAVGTAGPDVISYIIDDPDQLFIGQASSAAIGSSMIGLNLAVVPSTAGNTLTGQSVLTLAASIAGSTTATAQTYPVRVVDVYSNYAPPGVNGVDNANPFNIVVVGPVAWDRRLLTGRSTT